MLIINQNRDMLFDTTSAVMRIVYRETIKKYVVLGVNGVYGTVEISAHDTEEDAKKVLTIIRYAVASGATTCNLDEDVVNNLDTVIEDFEKLLGA